MSAAPKKSYFDLTKEAILDLKDRTGSSQQAIKAWIITKYPNMNFAQVYNQKVFSDLLSDCLLSAQLETSPEQGCRDWQIGQSQGFFQALC